MPVLSLPRELEKYRKEIEATLKPTIKIKTSNKRPSLAGSKFAGHPYMPHTAQHPKDELGNPMKLLAQINFEEVPNGLEDFPGKGLLQFFLSKDDDMMGLDLDNQTNQSNFRIIFHEEILSEDQLVSDFSYLDDSETDYFPVTKELSLSFELTQEPVSTADHAFEDFFEGIDFEEVVEVDADEELTLWEVYSEHLESTGHKLGGYAFFTQADPREDKEAEGHTVLLLQIDSDEDEGIIWGDVGVGNFFIKPEDLKKRDFSSVLYNWDCY